jgi:transcriptional regulator GlxA family with amidase domain
VNDFLNEAGKPPLFDVKIVGFAGEVTYNKGLFLVRPDATFGEVKRTDLVIIPSLSGYISGSVYLNKDCVSWITAQYKNGAEVASLCTGAFLLAFTGIMNGRQCTTHWAYANEFRYFYPGVRLVDEKMITDQDGLYSSGGSNAYWNLLVHLIEKYAGREMAIRTAKYFVIDIDKKNQSAFIIFNGLKDHEDELVLKVQDFIELHYMEKYTVDDIADKFYSTRRTLERRFKKATRNTVIEYLQRVKIEAAKKQIEIGRKTVTEIMLEVGYADMQTFREVFKWVTGMTPVDYRNKYNKR